MWIGFQWKGNSALFPSGNKAINLLQIPSLGIFLFYLIGFHWKLVFPFSGTEVVLMGIHWCGPWGFRRWGQFFNTLASSASVHHPELTPSAPDEVGRHGLSKAGQQPLPQLSLYVGGGRDGGPVLPVEMAGPCPEGPSNSTEASSKVRGCGPLRDFYSRTLFSAASNIANAESGFSARTSGLSNSTTWKSEKEDLKWAENIHSPRIQTTETPGEFAPTTSCTFPFSMTRTRSQLRTVLRRWAMVSTVQPLKASLMVLWTRVSVLESMEAVASSRRMICWGGHIKPL